MSGIPKLSDVMRSQTVTITNDGYEMESIAGKAFYSVSGVRGKVEGIPEYFPITLVINNKRNITQLVSDTIEGKLSSTYKFAVNSIPQASSHENKFSGVVQASDKGHLCGDTIEQATLSKVLASALYNVDPKDVSNVAMKLATAVKSAFNELNTPSGGFVVQADRFCLFGESVLKAGRPLSALKKGPNDDGKQVSTLKVKLELDSSDFQKTLDELSSFISKQVSSEITKELQPGGRIHSALKGHGSDPVFRNLASRIGSLENCVTTHSADITNLNLRTLNFS